MYRRFVLIVCVLTLGLLISSCNPSINMGYLPFPNGYDYMENLSTLNKATKEGNRKIIREHAWKLWAGIMQPIGESNWPVWYTWPNTTAAFKAQSAEKILGETDITQSRSGGSIIARNRDNGVKPSKMISETEPRKYPCKNSDGQITICVNTPNAPSYDIVPSQVKKEYPTVIKNDKDNNEYIVDGSHFQYNGDIMIPTESLSLEGMNNIRISQLYLTSKLDQLHKKKWPLEVTPLFIVTKHMYWPVKAQGVTAIPVWNNDFPDDYTDYVGYETWNNLVGVDPSGKTVGKKEKVKFLYNVKDHGKEKDLPTKEQDALVYGLDSFYYHKITKEDWDSFDEADKAILNAASYWANNQPIGIGDYLVTIAMHINTKELPSWTLQSVWWSDKPDQLPYAADRPELPQAKGPWNHYLLTDAYAIPPNNKGEVDITVNPYIEGVIHPIATSCRNCHIRAGWPKGKVLGTASYQNPDCSDLLSYLTPESKCLKPLTLTDYLWTIPDRAISK
ncbi:hypothetical protein [Anabaena azotica]|uniref:Cytochrome c domain-containing protein n=1 Tax=Anabaena azotica FACHB-119 TaxID=947527 RepID=A0ABR8D419_9NOST|nr:hypothetical protein [Anabaena azotica]MBD2501903.1 hypothetical protein [Anabaena azotica FACHB-119]